MNTLIVYYSLSGHTHKIAEEIAKGLGADYEQLKDLQPRAGLLGSLKTIYQTVFSRECQLKPISNNLDDYELIVIGGPVWIGNISSPVRSFIAKHKEQLNKLAFFCTEGSSGGLRVFKSLEKICAKQAIATLEVTEADIKSGQYNEKIDSFINTCKSSMADVKDSVAA